MSSDILHVDLDAFYASVAIREDPTLRGRPVVVGGDGRRGVVLSCSYEARARGVRNGMPSVRAKRLCPNAVFTGVDFELYTEASTAFKAILGSFTPHVEAISLDEAFCDVSGAHRLFGSSLDIAEAIRDRVRSELELACSVGTGPTKIVAKIASRAAKPDGVVIVDDPIAFLHPRPIEDLWGVGGVTASALRRIGIHSIGDLAGTPEGSLRSAVGEASAKHLLSLAHGRDRSRVEARGDGKSVGAESTFGADLTDPDEIGAELLRLSDRVASRLVEAHRAARTITVKIRLSDFSTYTRSKTIASATDDVWTIFATAREALAAFGRGRRPVRLLGVSASGLADGRGPQQLTFDPAPRYGEAEQAMADVRRRFGRGAVKLARLVGRRDRPRGPSPR